MKLDYGTQLSYSPIDTGYGHIRKPLLSEIANLSFSKFIQYESLMKLTPEEFLSQIITDAGISIWDSMSNEDRDGISIIDIISMNEYLQNQYEHLFDFFFVETIKFSKDHFSVLYSYNDDEMCEFAVIDKSNFDIVINIIEQICCIDDDKKPKQKPKFKNKRAREIYEKINRKKPPIHADSYNHTIPNLISSVSAMHNSINISNIWDITLFQLIDQFNRLTGNIIYNIECTRVSVWGDEKSKFDVSAWYKNNFDKK